MTIPVNDDHLATHTTPTGHTRPLRAATPMTVHDDHNHLTTPTSHTQPPQTATPMTVHVNDDHNHLTTPTGHTQPPRVVTR
jgi:hypothetical protein